MSLQDQRIREGMVGVPPPTWAPGSLLASGPGPLPYGPPSGHMGLREIGGRGVKKKRGQRGGTLWDRRTEGNLPSVSPTHLGPGSLLGSWTWSSTLQGKRHSRAILAALSLSPAPYPLKTFSGPVVPKHRPCPPAKPHPCLHPVTAKDFSSYFFPLFCYCGSVLSSSCCFKYIFYFF